MTTLNFHRLAAEELRKAHAWYAARNSGVADRFQQAVDDAVTRICGDPEAQPVAFKHFQWVRVRRFPYRLIFEQADEGRVLILAVAHTSRHSR
jgi:plasmid stabilization system protein ParE